MEIGDKVFLFVKVFLLAAVLVGFIVMVDFIEAWWEKRKGRKSGSVKKQGG